MKVLHAQLYLVFAGPGERVGSSSTLLFDILSKLSKATVRSCLFVMCTASESVSYTEQIGKDAHSDKAVLCR